MPAMAQQENLPAEDETVEGEIIVFGRGELPTRWNHQRAFAGFSALR